MTLLIGETCDVTPLAQEISLGPCIPLKSSYIDRSIHLAVSSSLKPRKPSIHRKTHAIDYISF